MPHMLATASPQVLLFIGFAVGVFACALVVSSVCRGGRAR